MTNNKILIVGGGFGGISAALTLEKENISNTEIALISDKSHFEYKPALYRVVTGRSPLEVCIPISEIFEKKNIAFALDAIKSERNIFFLKYLANRYAHF